MLHRLTDWVIDGWHLLLGSLLYFLFRPCSCCWRLTRCGCNPGGQGKEIRCVVKLFISPSTLFFFVSFLGACLSSELSELSFQILFLSIVPEPDRQCLGWACTRGVLDKERQGAGVWRALQTQVRAREVCQHHNRCRHHGRLWQIRPPGQEQVRNRSWRVHRQRLQPRGWGEQGGEERLKDDAVWCNKEEKINDWAISKAFYPGTCRCT